MLHVVLAALGVNVARAITKELYTTNAVCKQRYCVNPVFPGLHLLPQLEGERWVKHSLANVTGFLDFCAGFVDYDPALPLENGTTALERYLEADRQLRAQGGNAALTSALTHLANPTEVLVRSLDKLASKTYFYHLSGMGIEPWDHPDPAEASYHPLRPCARSVARLSCFTHFPQAWPSLHNGQEIRYTRPCKSSCENYIQACNVECCDEGVSCVWDSLGSDSTSSARRTQDLHGNTVLLQTGYVDANGPSFMCTGRAPSGTVGMGTAATLPALLGLWLVGGAAAA